jgi:hypothetical protein
MRAADTQTPLDQLPKAKRKLLLQLASALSEGDTIQLDTVVCQLPELGTEHLGVLRAGLEILFDVAGAGMVVDRATFLDCMARGQLPQSDPRRGGTAARPADSATRDDSQKERSGDLSNTAKADRGNARATEARKKVIVVSGEVVDAQKADSGKAESGRRRSTADLRKEQEAKEMRECSFAPKLTKYKGSRPVAVPCKLRVNASNNDNSVGGSTLAKCESKLTSRRAQKVEEMLEQRWQNEQKELTFTPKINPAPARVDKPAVRSSRESRELRSSKRSNYKWQESLRGMAVPMEPGVEPMGLSDDGEEFVDEDELLQTAPRPSFFAPPPRNGHLASRESSEERDGRPTTFKRSEGFAHQVVLR